MEEKDPAEAAAQKAYNIGLVVSSIILLVGLGYGWKTKQKVWYYLILLFIVSPVAHLATTTALSKTQ